jgi:hypothetical protein
MKLCYSKKTQKSFLYNGDIYDGFQHDDENYCVKDATGNENIYPKIMFNEIKILFKVVYTHKGKSDPCNCTFGKVYDVFYVDEEYYGIINDTNQRVMCKVDNIKRIPDESGQ